MVSFEPQRATIQKIFHTYSHSRENLGENPFGLAMYGGASMKFNSNQSICVTLTFLLILFATYQFDLVIIDTHDIVSGRQRFQLLRDSGQISIF